MIKQSLWRIIFLDSTGFLSARSTKTSSRWHLCPCQYVHKVLRKHQEQFISHWITIWRLKFFWNFLHFILLWKKTSFVPPLQSGLWVGAFAPNKGEWTVVDSIHHAYADVYRRNTNIRCGLCGFLCTDNNLHKDKRVCSKKYATWSEVLVKIDFLSLKITFQHRVTFCGRQCMF